MRKINSTQILRTFITVIASLAILTGCSKNGVSQSDLTANSNQNLLGSFFNPLNSLANPSDHITVTDLNGHPVPQVQVLIGSKVGQPFADNYLATDSRGQLTVPSGWISSQSVTLSAKGFVRATYFEQMPAGQVFQMRPAQTSNRFELKGIGTGFQIKDRDDKIDFALMIPVVSKQDLFAFDIGMFISPESDTVSAAGQKLDVPSNISLPKQTENYSFFPLTLEKPVYRMYFDTLGKRKVFAARGQFPFQKVVGELQNKKTFLDVINNFTLLGGSVKEVSISGAIQNMDFPVNEMNFNKNLSFHAPVFGTDEFLLAVPLSLYQGDLLPTDIKNVPADHTVKLSVATGNSTQLLVVVKKTAEQYAVGAGKLSAALVPFINGTQPTLLPLIDSPQVVNVSQIKIQVPVAPAGVIPVGTMSVLSQLETRTSGTHNYEVSTRVWEVYSPHWQSGFQLPEWPGDSEVVGKKRWEVSLLGSVLNKAVDLSPRILETMSHATHSATDFQ